MEESSEQYLYEYSIIEITTPANGDEMHMPIAFYHSNAVPPEIDSVLIPGEFSFGKEGDQEYKVLKIVLAPRSADVDHISDTTHVTLYVEKIDKEA